jgi:hypothetical protein
MVRGRYGYQPELPASPGAEGVGIVEAVGPGVQGSLVGTRVVFVHGPANRPCRREEKLRSVGHGRRHPLLWRPERRCRRPRRARREGVVAFSDERNKQSLADDLHGCRQAICGACGRPQYPVLRFAVTVCKCVLTNRRHISQHRGARTANRGRLPNLLQTCYG